MAGKPAWLGTFWTITWVALGAIPVEANPISFEFSGVVGQVKSGEPGIEPGHLISGRYTFESTTPGATPHGAYDEALLGIELLVDGRKVEFAATETNRIWVYDANHGDRRGGSDSYRLFGSAQQGFIDGIPVAGPLSLNITLVSSGETPFDGTTLPLLPVQVAQFAHAAYFQITIDTPIDRTVLLGQVTAITAPEPASAALLGLGLLLLAGRRAARRRRAAQRSCASCTGS